MTQQKLPNTETEFARTNKANDCLFKASGNGDNNTNNISGSQIQLYQQLMFV